MNSCVSNYFSVKDRLVPTDFTMMSEWELGLSQ